MTLQSSGAISFANINTELGVSSTTTRSLNDSASRTLAGVASGAISMSNFYGKSNVTFTPTGGNSAGSPTNLYNYGATLSEVTVTITCSIAATWTITRTGTASGASYASGTYSDLASLVLGLSGTSTPRSTTWTISGTAGGVTQYWSVTIDNDGTS